jgi:probable F420-dependent oxidoreductase
MAGIVEPGEHIYGIQLPIQTLTRRLRDPWEERAGVADLVEIARHAEATGHAFIGVCDHVAIPDDDYARHMSTTWYDTVATLGFLAAHTERVRLLSAIYVAGYRHPLQTASAFGTLGHLSGGRAILGVGAGHVQGEFEALGIPFAERGAILDECLDALRGVFAADYASFQGKRVSYREMGVAPRPPSGELPIWIGGSGRAAWKRCGRVGDGYIPMANPLEEFPEILATIRASAEDHGRGDARFDIGWMPPWTYVGKAPEDLPDAQLHGEPEHIAEVLRAGLQAGANVLHLKFRSRSKCEYLDQLSAFHEQVAPLLR